MPHSNHSEVQAFQHLQERLAEQFRRIFPDEHAPRTVVIIPSLTLDQDVLDKITGVIHYEERMLCLLLLLRLPNTRVVYITSEPIPEVIVDYYLHLLPGIPRHHALRRLTLLCCHDAAPQCLTAKILARPRLVDGDRSGIGRGAVG